ncbi:MAG: hypothetical protein IPN80_07965 [Flavobacterium sp.]|nr:hypothetical protein [Flavobacterium sp.]
MNSHKFSDLKNQVQEIIDLMAKKDFIEANFKLLDACEYLDEVLDFSEKDSDLIEISKYKVLLHQLEQKINLALNL